MRTALPAFLTIVFIFTSAPPAFSMHFEMTGRIQVRGWYMENYWPRDNDSVQKGDVEFVDQRMRLGMYWGFSPQVQLIARADVLEGLWGTDVGQATEVLEVNPATGASVQGPSFTNIQPKEEIAFDQIYATFKWPGAPVLLLVGRQPVRLGNGTVANQDNRDRFQILMPHPFVKVRLGHDKLIESFTQELVGDASDSRVWWATLEKMIAGWKLGGGYAMVLNETTPAEGVFPAGSIPSLDNTFHLFSVYTNGVTGIANWKADISYLTGEAGLKGRPKADVEGLAFYAGGFLYAGLTMWGLELAWCQGNDPDTPDVEGALNFDYHAPFNSVVLFNGMDYQGYDNLARNVTGDIGLNNAVALKGSITVDPTERLDLNLALVWAKRDQVQEPGRSDDLGVELDLTGTYRIYDNVALRLAAGYLWAGDFYRNEDGSGVKDPLLLSLGTEIKF